MHDVRVFLAGAGGAIGTRLVPLLLDAGYDVFGTTRSKERAGALEAAGVKPIGLPEALARNARIRSEGTRNLVAAAIEAGVRRLIAQSIAWVYAPGPEPHSEDDPLDIHAEGTRAVTVGGVVALERFTLGSPPLAGIVLRYGQLYGPGTGKDEPANSAPLHVDAAASAALLASRYARSGTFNI